MAKRCKLEVVGIHNEQFAAIKTFEYMFRRGADEKANAVNMYIDLGAITTKVTVTHCKDVKFVKTIHLGGNQMTLEYAKRHNIEFGCARLERMRIAQGIEIEEKVVVKETAKVGADDSASEQNAIINSSGEDHPEEDTLEMIVDELKHCVRFHQHLYPNDEIGKLIFLGGESHHMNTCHQIAKSLRIKAQLGDPLGRLDREHLEMLPDALDRDKSHPGWAVVMGLCLSEANLM